MPNEMKFDTRIFIALFSALVSILATVYLTGSFERVPMLVLLGVPLILNAAYFFANIKNDTVRRSVFFIVMGSTLAWPFLSAELNYSIDSSYFLGANLLLLVILNFILFVKARRVE